jgi:large subunit ribosomal protein L17
MVTLGKKGTIHHRRLAASRLHQEDAARILFKEIAPAFKDRRSGYTRIIRLGGLTGKSRARSQGDAAERVILEWVDTIVEATAPIATAPGASATETTPTTPATATTPAAAQPAEVKPAETKAEEKK